MTFLTRERTYVRSFFPAFDWVTEDAPSPRNPLRVPLGRATVGLVSTAGAFGRGQERFSTGDDGDASHRAFGWDEAVRFAHPGYDTRRARRDAEVVLPRRTLDRLAADGTIGGTPARAFSLMGYIPDPRQLLEETAPLVAAELLADAVDLVLLVPT